MKLAVPKARKITYNLNKILEKYLWTPSQVFYNNFIYFLGTPILLNTFQWLPNSVLAIYEPYFPSLGVAPT